MALTAQEQEFYKNFVQFLKEDGINDTNPHRLSEYLIYPDNANNNLQLAMIENYDNKEVSESWLEQNTKNPTDSDCQPTELHIKALYKAFSEGRLCQHNISFTNPREMQNDLSFLYEAEDGSIKRTKPISEIEKDYPLRFSQLTNAKDFANLAINDKETGHYLTSQFGKDSLDVAKLVIGPTPKKPGFFTRAFAKLKIKKAQDRINTYNKYQEAKETLEKIGDTIIKKAFPGVKDISTIKKHLSNNNAPDAIRSLALANHKTKTEQVNEEKLEALTSDKDDIIKDDIRFVLDNQYNTTYSKNMRDFLRDIPDIYDTLSYHQDTGSFEPEQLQTYLFQSSDSLELQKQLSKFAIFKLIKDDIKQGKMDSPLIEMIEKGEGKDLVNSLRVTHKALLKDAEVVNNVISGSTKEVQAEFKDFVMNASITTKKDVTDYNARIFDEKIANTGLEDFPDLKELHDTIQMYASKRSLSADDLKEVIYATKAMHRSNPSVDNYSKWRVYTAAYNHMKEHPETTYVSKKAFDKAIDLVNHRISDNYDFAQDIENQKYENPADANLEFSLTFSPNPNGSNKELASEVTMKVPSKSEINGPAMGN